MPTKPGIAHIDNLNNSGVEAGGLEIQGPLLLHRKCVASLGFVRPYSKIIIINKNNNIMKPAQLKN